MEVVAERVVSFEEDSSWELILAPCDVESRRGGRVEDISEIKRERQGKYRIELEKRRFELGVL